MDYGKHENVSQESQSPSGDLNKGAPHPKINQGRYPFDRDVRLLVI
jgi:hypothetical protein